MQLVARDLMERNVLTIPTELPFREIQHLFVVAGCQGAPVVDAEGHVVGIVSAIDLLRAADQAYDDDRDPGEGYDATVSTLTAGELATPEPVWVRPDTPAYEVAQLMQKEGIHRVLVGTDGKVAGILSAFDLVRAILE